MLCVSILIHSSYIKQILIMLWDRIMAVSPSSQGALTLYQSLTLDTTRSYTGSFYATLFSFSQAQKCTLKAFLGSNVVFTKDWTSADRTGNGIDWKGPLTFTTTTIPTSDQALKFTYECMALGTVAPTSALFLDDVTLYAV